MSFSQSGGNFSSPQFSQAPDFQPYQHAKLNPMPEERPGLMSLLAQSLGSGLGEGVAGGIQQQLKRSALDKMLSNINPNMSPKERLLTVAGSDAETQPLIQNYFDQQDLQRQQQEKLQREAASQQQKNAFELQKQERAHEFKVIENQRREEAKAINSAQKIKKNSPAGKLDEEEKVGVQKTFDRMANLLGQGRLGNPITTGGPLNRQRQEDMAEFDSLNIQLESIAKEMVSKGVLAKDRFKFMIDNLPNAANSDRENKGKLKAVAQILGLDVKELNKELSSRKNIPKVFKSGPPPADKFNGRIITNPETGERMQSNGSEWMRIE